MLAGACALPMLLGLVAGARVHRGLGKSTHPTHPFMGDYDGEGVCCQNVFPGLPPGSPLMNAKGALVGLEKSKLGKFWEIFRKSDRSAKLNNQFSCFLGEGDLFYGLKIFPHPPNPVEGGIMVIC